MIRQEIKKSNITWRHYHVKGHQDNTTSFESLDVIAQGNVLVDYLAAEQYRQPQSQPYAHNWIPAINGHTLISGDVENQLLSRIYRSQMEQRWSRLFDIDSYGQHNNQHHMDWDLFFCSIKSQHRHIKPFFTKYNARILPVGTNLKRRRHSSTDLCPCCDYVEDHDHLIQCTHNKMENTFNDLLMNLSTFLSGNTSTIIVEGITTLLEYFSSGQSEPPESEAGIRLYQEQKSLGPRAFFAGLWFTGWQEHQEQYLQEIKSKRSARLWITRLIHKIQEIPWHMWNTRNDILHQTTDNTITKEQHRELDLMIDGIFARKPHSRHMAHCDNAFFKKHDIQRVKQMTIRRKTNWITGANLILTKYERVATTQSERFMSFFQWDRG